MNFDFIRDVTDDEESSPTIRTGWENVIFELEDEPLTPTLSPQAGRGSS